jgi:aminopeptidase N
MKPKSYILLPLIIKLTMTIAWQTGNCGNSVQPGEKWISDTLDALTYTIYITEFDFANHEITAQADISMVTKVNNLNLVKLEIMDLTVDQVMVDGNVAAGFTHIGNILTISLTAPVNTGDTIAVSVNYHGEPFHEEWGGFHWAGNYCFNLGVGFVSVPHNLGKTWFPCIDDFHDRALYTIYATVPESMDAVCGGLLEEIVDNGNGTLTYQWNISHSIPTYLASVAVGDYARWTGTYNGMEGEIPIEIWVMPQDSDNVAGSFVHLDDIMQIFEQSFGPYRWERIGYVGTAIGAMEHATNVAYPHFAVNGGLQYESLYAHELSHMWFGDNVTCASAEDMWLNEGWAVFSDARSQEVLYGEEQYKDFIRTKHKQIIQYCHTSSGDGSYFPLNQIPQEYTYGMTAYDRGATVAHTLRGYLGDVVFFDAMAAYNEYFQHNYASSENFRDFLTLHTGIDMTGWFDNWVFHSGTPEFSVDSFDVVPNVNGSVVTVYLRQKRHGPSFTGNSNKVELTFMDQNWNTHNEVMTFDGATGSSVWTLLLEPEAVFIDLSENMCDAVTDYTDTIDVAGTYNYGNSFFKLEVDAINEPAFIRIEHHWAPPDTIKNPVQGLKISPYRYWKFDGILPEEFTATGVFMYNKSAFLDDSLILSQSDSVVMLYRSGTAFDWQFVDFSQVGIWSIGNLFVENLQKGEYALAVCDDTFVDVKKNQSKKNSGLLIYPNPSNNSLYIESKQSGTVCIYNTDGRMIETIVIPEDGLYQVHHKNNLAEGTYLTRFQSADGTISNEGKIVIIQK